jgi:hypothetical protein
METVTITKQEYDSLKKDQLRLTALEDAGVDNWEQYHYHWETYNELLRENGYEPDEF